MMELGLSKYSAQNSNGQWSHLKDKDDLYLELYALNATKEKIFEDSIDVSNLYLKLKIKSLELEVIDFKDLTLKAKNRNVLNTITVSFQDESNSIHISYFSEHYSSMMRPLSVTFLDKLQFLEAYKFFNTFARFINIEKKVHPKTGNSQPFKDRINANTFFESGNNFDNKFLQMGSQFRNLRNDILENNIIGSQGFIEPSFESQSNCFGLNSAIEPPELTTYISNKLSNEPFYKRSQVTPHESLFISVDKDNMDHQNEGMNEILKNAHIQINSNLLKNGKENLVEFLSEEPCVKTASNDIPDEELLLCRKLIGYIEDSEFKKLVRISFHVQLGSILA